MDNDKKLDRVEGFVKKGWGYELVWANTENYCGKILVFEKIGSKQSMHFHKEKTKSYFVNNGRFKIRWIGTDTAEIFEKEFVEGEIWHCPNLTPHQLECLEDNSSITEVGTRENFQDVYRLIPGDTQKEILDNG